MGNIISRMGHTPVTYDYDCEQRLTYTQVGDFIDTQFTYDGRGNRLEVTRNGESTFYGLDASGNVPAEVDHDTGHITSYIYGLGLVAKITDTYEIYTYHFNATGSTIAITDQSQNIVGQYAYTPFGIMVWGGSNEFFKFAGQHGVMTEPHSYPHALHYMRARYYDPYTGRFLHPDPIGFAGGMNLYVYCKNNPIMFVDPDGLWTFQIGGSFTAGGLLGSTKGGGLIIGRNPHTKDWQFGWYAVGGAGAYGGASASAVVDFTWSGNPNIEGVGGWASTAGGSGNVLGASVGGEVNTPITGEAQRSYTFSMGGSARLPGEGHGYVTYTHVQRFGSSHKGFLYVFP